MDTTTTEAPVTSAPADLSLSDIIANAVAEADAAGAETVVDEAPKTGDAPATEAPAETTPATEETPPADDKPADDVTAARVRKMLAKVEEREAAVLAREQRQASDLVAEMVKSPKAFLAKHGRSIDDVIDASIAEGKGEPAPAADESSEVAELRKRLDAREAREAAERNDAAIKTRTAEIHRDIAAASTKFPLVNELKRHGVVTDVMVAYHQEHGKPISWDRAAALVEADLKAIRGTTAAAAPAATATTPTPRPGTTTLAGDTRTAAQVDGDEPDDPRQLIAFFARKAGVV